MPRKARPALRRPASPTLARRAATSLPKRLVVIFCEGATEEDYLNVLAGSIRGPLIDIQVSGQVGVPESVVNRAIVHRSELLRREGRSASDSFEALFSVWAMFDKDDHDVSAPIQRAKAAGVNVAFSNPCFELWGILHFEDHDAPDNRRDVQRRLRELMPSYDHERHPYFTHELLTLDRERDAALRASTLRQRRHDEGDAQGNPHTTVDNLVNQIRLTSEKRQSIADAKEEISIRIETVRSTEEYKNGDQIAHRTVRDLFDRLKSFDNA